MEVALVLVLALRIQAPTAVAQAIIKQVANLAQLRESLEALTTETQAMAHVQVEYLT
jgi:hypothetical protein